MGGISWLINCLKYFFLRCSALVVYLAMYGTRLTCVGNLNYSLLAKAAFLSLNRLLF